MKTREQMLMSEIRISKQRLNKYRAHVKMEERNLNEAESALKRLNEEERKKLSTFRQEANHDHQRED